MLYFLKQYDFIVHPGGNPENIAMKISGADKLYVDNHGTLAIETPLGLIEQQKPYSYQDNEVYSAFTLYKFVGFPVESTISKSAAFTPIKLLICMYALLEIVSICFSFNSNALWNFLSI